MTPDITDFEILPDYRIKVTLSNGTEGIFDVTPYLGKGIFKELKDPTYLGQARIEYGTITWPHKQDFCPDTIEAKMEKIMDMNSSCCSC